MSNATNRCTQPRPNSNISDKSFLTVRQLVIKEMKIKIQASQNKYKN